MYHYYQFHKPAGCVTALRDEHKPTIMQYLSNLDMSVLRPVGRLDMDTEGLLILTDDGAYNQKMTNPEHEIEKEYIFYALGIFTEEKQKALELGNVIPAKDGREGRPAYITVNENMTLEQLPTYIKDRLQERTLKNRPQSPVFTGHITVTEGRKHEVKRLLKGIGCYCIYLKRIRMGNIRLFEDLEPGEVREFKPVNNILFSVGHSQHKLDYFLSLLTSYNVDFILDVRSTPYSQFASDYNRENIKAFLLKNGIRYAYMGDYFGARQEEQSFFSKEGYLDFEVVAKSVKYRKAFLNVEEGIRQGYHIAFMCTEKDPLDCHRAILVTYTFYQAGYSIQHIMEDNTVQTQQDINERLLDLYFPSRKQLSFFSEDNLSDEQYLLMAYRKQNEKIGYRKI